MGSFFVIPNSRARYDAIQEEFFPPFIFTKLSVSFLQQIPVLADIVSARIATLQTSHYTTFTLTNSQLPMSHKIKCDMQHLYYLP